MEVPQTLLWSKKIQYSELCFIVAAALFLCLLLRRVAKVSYYPIFIPVITYVAMVALSGVGALDLDKRRYVLEVLGVAYLACVFFLILQTTAHEDEFPGFIKGVFISWLAGFAIVNAGIVVGFLQGYVFKRDSIFLIHYPAPGRYQLIHRFIPRIVSTLRSPDMMLSYLIASFGLLPIWWKYFTSKKVRIILAAMVCVSMVGAFLSTARGIVGLLFCTLALSYLLSSRRAIRFTRVILILGIINLAAFFALLTVFEPSRVEVGESAITGEKQLKVDFHIANKYFYGKYALTMFKDHPLKGVGAGNFNAALPRYYEQDPYKDANFKDFVKYDPHNTHLGLLGEIGLIGWLSFISIFAFIAASIITARRKSISRESRLLWYGVAAAIGGIFLQSFTMDIQNLRHLWVLAALGYGRYLYETKKRVSVH